MPLSDLWEWLGRLQQRQRDLAAGVDVDLVRANRKRYKLAWILYALGFMLLGLQGTIKLRGPFREIAVVLTLACIIGGMVVIRWAMIEQANLEKPRPKEQPKMWTWR